MHVTSRPTYERHLLAKTFSAGGRGREGAGRGRREAWGGRGWGGKGRREGGEAGGFSRLGPGETDSTAASSNLQLTAIDGELALERDRQTEGGRERESQAAPPPLSCLYYAVLLSLPNRVYLCKDPLSPPEIHLSVCRSVCVCVKAGCCWRRCVAVAAVLLLL